MHTNNPWLCQSALDNEPSHNSVAWNRIRYFVQFCGLTGLAWAVLLLASTVWAHRWGCIHLGAQSDCSTHDAFIHLSGALVESCYSWGLAWPPSLHADSHHPVICPMLIYMAAVSQECKNRTCKSSWGLDPQVTHLRFHNILRVTGQR